MGIETKIVPKKEDCEHFSSNQCKLYQGECFHVNGTNDHPFSGYRCNKIIPRTEEELSEWMDLMLCSDCNEVICNDCDQYLSFKDYEEGFEL